MIMEIFKWKGCNSKRIFPQYFSPIVPTENTGKQKPEDILKEKSCNCIHIIFQKTSRGKCKDFYRKVCREGGSKAYMEMFAKIFFAPLKINSSFSVPQKISLWKFSELVVNTSPTTRSQQAWEAPTSSIIILYGKLWIPSATREKLFSLWSFCLLFAYYKLLIAHQPSPWETGDEGQRTSITAEVMWSSSYKTRWGTRWGNAHGEHKL